MTARDGRDGIGIRVLGLLVMGATISGWLACDVNSPLQISSTAPSPTTTTTTTTTVATDPAQLQQEMLARWNRAAGVAQTTLSFQWPSFDQFPHPTYKGGSAEAYQAFAQVLLDFFQSDDNFDFLARNHLFDLRLRYVFPSGQVGIETSFKELAIYFSSPSGFGDIPADTRARLGDYANRMTP